jgi:hypothetical protein
MQVRPGAYSVGAHCVRPESFKIAEQRSLDDRRLSLNNRIEKVTTFVSADCDEECA